MTSESQKQTAKIYQFPDRNLAVAGHGTFRKNQATIREMQMVPAVDFGSGWYHDEAISEVQSHRPR